jgi:hypothetical protein
MTLARLTYDNVEDTIESKFFWAKITNIYSSDDTADIKEVNDKEKVITPERIHLKCPIFYHCKPDAETRPNKALKGSSAAFKINDIVYCRRDPLPDKPKVLTPKKLKPCSEGFTFIIEPVSPTGVCKQFIYDINSNSFKTTADDHIPYTRATTFLTLNPTYFQNAFSNPSNDANLNYYINFVSGYDERCPELIFISANSPAGGNENLDTSVDSNNSLFNTCIINALKKSTRTSLYYQKITGFSRDAPPGTQYQTIESFGTFDIVPVPGSNNTKYSFITKYAFRKYYPNVNGMGWAQKYTFEYDTILETFAYKSAQSFPHSNTESNVASWYRTVANIFTGENLGVETSQGNPGFIFWYAIPNWGYSVITAKSGVLNIFDAFNHTWRSNYSAALKRSNVDFDGCNCDSEQISSQLSQQSIQATYPESDYVVDGGAFNLDIDFRYDVIGLLTPSYSLGELHWVGADWETCVIPGHYGGLLHWYTRPWIFNGTVTSTVNHHFPTLTLIPSHRFFPLPLYLCNEFSVDVTIENHSVDVSYSPNIAEVWYQHCCQYDELACLDMVLSASYPPIADCDYTPGAPCGVGMMNGHPIYGTFTITVNGTTNDYFIRSKYLPNEVHMDTTNRAYFSIAVGKTQAMLSIRTYNSLKFYKKTYDPDTNWSSWIEITSLVSQAYQTLMGQPFPTYHFQGIVWSG